MPEKKPHVQDYRTLNVHPETRDRVTRMSHRLGLEEGGHPTHDEVVSRALALLEEKMGEKGDEVKA